MYEKRMNSSCTPQITLNNLKVTQIYFPLFLKGRNPLYYTMNSKIYTFKELRISNVFDKMLTEAALICNIIMI